MQNADKLIHARWIIPVDNKTLNQPINVLNHHAIAIKDGKILDVVPSDTANNQFNVAETLELPDHALMPGFVNTHTHSPMVLFRGLADDLALMDWLNNHIWPAEKKWCNEEYIRDGMLLACAEMIRSGTTCFNEHYFFPKIAAEIADQVGMRARIGLFMMTHPTNYASDEQDYLNKAQDAIENGISNDRIDYCYAPHGPYTCSDELLIQIKNRVAQDNLRIHMHVHESQSEIDMSLEAFGMRPIKRMHDLGLLGPHFIHVHMTQVNDEDLAIIKDTGGHVVHCPESNLKLASGYCEVQKLLDNNVNVCLGTDGAASNNDLDMFGEMRTAALIGKTIANDPTAVSANTALKMSTINGAKALGLDNTIGRLAPGLAADFIAVDMSAINTQPIFNPVSHLVYSTNSRQVSDVWVAGKQLLKQGKLTTINETQLMKTIQNWQEKIQGDVHVTA